MTVTLIAPVVVYDVHCSDCGTIARCDTEDGARILAHRHDRPAQTHSQPLPGLEPEDAA